MHPVRKHRPVRSLVVRPLVAAAALTAGAVWGCESFTVSQGEITVSTFVSGDVPPGTWHATISHTESGESAEKRVGSNASVTFTQLQTVGKWIVVVGDDGQLGAGYSCTPSVMSYDLIDIDIETANFSTTCTLVLEADAGADATQDVGQTVALDGTASVLSAGTHASWSIVSAPTLSTSQVGNATSLQPDPFLIDEPGVYVLRLTLTDGAVQDADEVTLTANPPEISDVQPRSGSEGTPVTITGKNFSPTLANSTVAFNGTASVVVTASATVLTTTVPPGATGGPVTVTIESTGDVATGPVFTTAPWTFEFSIPSGTLPSGDFQAVSFADLQTGMTVASNRTVLRTVDGGVTWSAVTPLDASVVTPVGISVPTPDVAYIVTVATGGVATIQRTANGGADWTPVRNDTPILDDVVFVSADEGWAVGAFGTILHTSNGGGTWEAQTSGTMQTLRKVVFAGPQLGIAIGDGGTIVRTTDGGATDWVATTVTGILRDLSFADANNGIILASESGVTSLFVTTTGGASWVPVSPVLPTPFTASAIALAGSGVVTLAGGTSNSTLSLYRSTDAGQNWLFEQGTTREIADIVMFDPATGVAVGNGIVGRRQ